MRRLTLHDMHSPVQIGPDGVARIGGTRVTLDTVVAAYRNGCTAEEVVEQYPSLPLAAVHGAIAYYLMHREEIEAYLAGRGADAETLQSEVALQGSQAGARERILARQSAKRNGT